MSLKSKVVRELKKQPLNAKQLGKKLGVESKKISKALYALQQEKAVVRDKGLYVLKISEKPKQSIDAKLVKLGKSFGFVAPLDGSDDIFVPGRCLMGALPGDLVKVVLFDEPRVAGSREGEVIAIDQVMERIVGTVEFLNGKLVLIPDNAQDTPLVIKRNADAGVQPGEKAAAEILVRGQRHSEHKVGITLRLGSADSAKQCAEAILYGNSIERVFPTLVQQEAKKVGKMEITAADILEREDFRDLYIFTIDSESTKDIDDALSIEKQGEYYLLGVHIADVSHYVQPKTPLDREAMERGTSIYFADSVIPMLPKELSNGICSLNPNEDRLAFSCFIKLDKNGKMLEYKFMKSIICSQLKGVYSEINDLFAKTASKQVQQKYEQASDSLFIMKELYEKLAVLRKERGCMEIESEEPKIIVDENGVCVGIEKRERGVSEHLIEEFMLLANTAAAHLAKSIQIPFVYRVHEDPSTEKLERLKDLLKVAGIPSRFKGEIPTQKELAAVLDVSRGTNMMHPVHNAVLRSMAKAKYEPEPKGHYGLALEDYAHFTSPIRRYPDLAIHRILTDVVQGLKNADIKKRYKKFAHDASQASSEKELTAQKIERDCDDCYKAEYMRQFIGQTFTGTICSVVQFGLYVELENTIEGLVHISELSKDAMHIQDGISLTDLYTGKKYSIGDKMQVQLAGVNVAQGNIDFIPVAGTQ